MSLSDAAAIGGVVSSIAVLISLVYLALQVRQAAHNQRSETQSNATARRIDILFRVTEEHMAMATLRGGAADPEISPLQTFQFITSMQAVLTNWEDEFFQYRNGMLDERRFRLSTTVSRAMFGQPGVRALWRISKTNYHPDFIAHMDENMRQATPTTASIADAWKPVAAEERAAAVTAH